MSKHETDEQREIRQSLEEITALLLKKIVAENREFLPPNTGFALFLFDYGREGNLAYASTARRQDMIQVLREWLEIAREN